MEEVRCNSCHQLFFKASPDARGEVEVVCKRCKRLAKIVLPLKRWRASDVRLELAARTSVTGG